MIRIATAVVVSLLTGASLSSGDAQRTDTRDRDRGLLAVLRRDGLLLPFASFRNGEWKAPWPASLRNVEIPATMEAVPEAWWGGERPSAMQAWLRDGTSRSVAFKAPAVIPVGCQPRLTIRTDYKSTEPLAPPGTEPHPKDGLAIAGASQSGPIEIVTDADATVKLAVTLLPEFDKAEENAVVATRRGSGWRHPAGPARRRSTPVRIESWYRAPLLEDGWTLSYVEAVRAYPPRPEDEECGLETLFSGWIRQHASGTAAIVDMSAKITYCDRVGAVFMLPFGTILTGDRLHWVFQLSGWEEEWYEVVQVSAKRIRFVAEYYGGGESGCRNR